MYKVRLFIIKKSENFKTILGVNRKVCRRKPRFSHYKNAYK